MRADEYRAMFDLEERLWWYAGMRAITASILERVVELNNPCLLDIGCGTGFSLLWLKELLGSTHAFGVDLSEHAAALWSERGLDTVARARASRLPFASKEFDLVTCFDVIYQFEREESREAIAEMNRVLRPDGCLFIREPAYDWMRSAHDVAVGTRHRFTRKEIVELLEAEGFRIERATYANTLLFPLAASHRLLSRIRGGQSSDVRPVPRLINRALAAILKIEAGFIRSLNFPFGLSVVALAQKVN